MTDIVLIAKILPTGMEVDLDKLAENVKTSLTNKKDFLMNTGGNIEN